VAGGASLYAPQAQNNIVRVAYEALASVLGGVQSMFTAAWDEPFALPTAESTTLALRTQQILAYETGVARVVDPLGGSYYVEALTDAMEEAILATIDEIDEVGGMVRAVEEGHVQRIIADGAYRAQQRLEAGEKLVVGVNTLVTQDPVPEAAGFEMDEGSRQVQLERLARVKQTRDAVLVGKMLKQLRDAADSPGVNLMPPLIDCALAYCTVGEIVHSLKDAWGEFVQPVVF
jgi:methylmalonyl-CoA mutase N-terminal domain/subunit